MKLAALISGGKDSIYAAFKASKQHEIVCLISFKSKREDSYMFHIPNIDLVKLQAISMNLPLIFMESSGIKEKELEDIKKALKIAIKKYKIEGVVSGAIASNYQKSRIDTLCNELKLSSIAPLWHTDPEQYLKDLIKNNFEVIITGIAAEGLTKDFLGKEIDKQFLEKIEKLNINKVGEGGEYESLVLDCPLFRKKLKIKSLKNSKNFLGHKKSQSDFFVKAKVVMENYCTGKFIVEDVELAGK